MPNHAAPWCEIPTGDHETHFPEYPEESPEETDTAISASQSSLIEFPFMMRELYKEILLDHFERPRNRREIEGAEIEEHLNNPLCGDQVTVFANDRVEGLEVSFTGRGCSISQASASMLTERLMGKSREEAQQEIEAFLEMMRTESNEDLGELAALKDIVRTPNRVRCATLAWDALKRGLEHR